MTQSYTYIDNEDDNSLLLKNTIQTQLRYFRRCCHRLNTLLIEQSIDFSLEQFISWAYELFQFSFTHGYEFDLLQTPLIDRFIKSILVREGLIKDDLDRNFMNKLSLKPNFTSKEIAILAQISLGKTAKQIAEALQLSPRTVEIHILSLKRKTNSETKSQLKNFIVNDL